MISVVIPVYNVSMYIERCLISLDKQTYKDFEIIMINDGSNDESEEIIKKWIINSKLNIHLISKDNQGVSIARNIGIENARGDLICFVDADDMLDTNYLFFMYSTIVNNLNCDVAICQKKLVDNVCIESSVNKDACCYTYEKSLTILRMLLYHELSAGIWSLMIKKSLLLKCNLKFAEGYAYSEDLEMVWRIIGNAKEIALIMNSLYCYRIRTGSAMASFDSKRKDGYILFQQLEVYFGDTRKDFADEFKRYGVAYWVWSTVSQAVNVSKSYTKFNEMIRFMNIKKYMPKLYSYPILLVKISAIIFNLCRPLYWLLIKCYFNKISNKQELELKYKNI